MQSAASRLAVLAPLTVALTVVASAPAAAQLSPGPLSQAHAELEGSANCLSCHQAQTGVDAGRCLDCHEPLATRIEAGLGLHARDGYDRCERCHIEHHGRDFELVWWGDEGRESFDHTLTGFALEGAHARAECGDCHRAGSMVDAAALEAAGKDLTRTFLGLEPSCLSCHEDSHRGQFAADRCAECHGFDGWSPPAAFDHARTLFPLTGLHRRLDCVACHRTVRDAGATAPGAYLHFDVSSFASCSDCHADPHAGRLGSRCESCHSTHGWSRVDRGAFDHDRTRFALTGAHVRVECAACHGEGSGFRVERFEQCTDCHRDEHLGQFSSRGELGVCTSCHTVEAFVPSTFTLADHQRSGFELEGAHLAVPCIACHRTIAAADLAAHHPVAEAAVSAVDGVRQFRFDGTGCADCHGDPHDGALELASCESCHELSSWRAITFDHETTGLPLRGAHGELGCRDCHEREPEPGVEPAVGFLGLSASCAGCHEDPHAGQFATGEGGVACARCHDETGWTELLFDHDRDARFRLEGAHLRLACGECHATESDGERAFIRYRPLGRTCEDCHAGELPPP